MSKIDPEDYLRAKKLVESVNEQLASDLEEIVNKLARLLQPTNVTFEDVDLVILLSQPQMIEIFSDILERLKNPLLELHIKQIAKEYENI